MEKYGELVKYLLSLEYPIIPLGIHRAGDFRAFGTKYPFFITCPPLNAELLAGDIVMVIGDYQGYQNAKKDILKVVSNALILNQEADNQEKHFSAIDKQELYF